LESLFGNVTFDDRHWREHNEPFWLIAETVLSQNTSSANSRAAFRSFFSQYQTVQTVALADVRDIEDAIKQAGLYEAKARTISAVAREVIENYGGDTWSFIGGSYQSARERLQTISGIGPKTADVVLVFARDFDVIPVDTHVFRVSRRIGLAPLKGGYEVVKTALEAEIPAGKRKFAHTALIRLGREICVARGPRHGKCPLTDICDYYLALPHDVRHTS
ncbi:MAG TPA: endonuclease III, partial [Candidatus Bathyarchaeia archaeon]|nr:endonuclease III [Candidatus Bathyarchaeia archaeon]